jgi:hypothetical protein
MIILTVLLPLLGAPVPLVNPGFEHGLSGWTIPPGEGMTTLASDQAASGKHALHVVDQDPRRGSQATATPVGIKPGTLYQLRGKGFAVSGGGLGIYALILDRQGKRLVRGDTFQRGLGGTDRTWRPFTMWIVTPPGAAALQIEIHSYDASKVEAYLDDLELVDLSDMPARAPWEGQYKIRPSQTARLTPADVVGPDGIVYPNWTRCGVQGGIPSVKPVVTLEECGGRADDGRDDAPALEQAVQTAAARGGGSIVFGAGTYHFDRPVTIRQSGIVLRGQGRDTTHVIFRYAIPAAGCTFYAPAAGARVGPGTLIEFHAVPAGLQKVTLSLDGKPIHIWTRGLHSGNSFSCRVDGSRIAGRVPDGRHTLEGMAEYEDGTHRRCTIPVVADRQYRDPAPVASTQGVFVFQGSGPGGRQIKLLRDGKRGDVRLALETTQGLAAGDCLRIRAPATPRWKALIQDECPWSNFRVYDLDIERVDGREVVCRQPLRIEFPVIDGSFVQKLTPIRRCGVEDMDLEQTENLWISSIVFAWGWDCWARGVRVRMTGRFPVYGAGAKWCEVRDCVFDDAWFKGGGGTAYVGWFTSCDCLMENVETFQFRHAPLFESSAAGCVIRKSVFHASDGQWHSGWTNENLFEQCVIESTVHNGSYGYGLWASPPEDEAHGPNGPRNVVYNCDVRSPKDGVWLGGMNENWLFLHNRFVVDRGPGVTVKSASFDHMFRNNVFVLRDGKSPMIDLVTPDCVGIEATQNLMAGGNGRVTGGLGRLALDANNRLLPAGAVPPRPQPAVPSIFEWQLSQSNHRGTANNQSP